MSKNSPRRRRTAASAARARIVPGSAPGVLVDNPDAQDSTVRAMGYDAGGLVEEAKTGTEGLAALRRRGQTLWVDVHGLGDIAAVCRLGQEFGLHPLALEDVVNVHQRPKVEVYDDHLFVVLRMPSLAGRLETEQLSLFLGPGYVLTFQERPGDCLDPVRERLRKGKGRIRGAGADYLAYALIDAVVDHYFPILEHYGEAVEELSEAVFQDPHDSLIFRIHEIKRDFMALRRAIFPLRETLSALQRDDVSQISRDTRVYLRDCYDHVVQLMDLVESFREVSSGLMEAYQSSVGFRTNEVMRVLTIFATIFIPLTFVAGIYGMNFDPAASRFNMPELGWAYGYPALLAVMVTMTISLLVYFRRKGWLVRSRSPRGE